MELACPPEVEDAATTAPAATVPPDPPAKQTETPVTLAPVHACGYHGTLQISS